jgi:hypothetical protein
MIGFFSNNEEFQIRYDALKSSLLKYDAKVRSNLGGRFLVV